MFCFSGFLFAMIPSCLQFIFLSHFFPSLMIMRYTEYQGGERDFEKSPDSMSFQGGKTNLDCLFRKLYDDGKMTIFCFRPIQKIV